VTLNETAYAENGDLYLGTQMLWGIFFDYASYTSGIAWVFLFGYPQLRAAFPKLRARDRGERGKSINWQYDDQLNILQRSCSGLTDTDTLFGLGTITFWLRHLMLGSI
jgi:hypothetical protein